MVNAQKIEIHMNELNLQNPEFCSYIANIEREYDKIYVCTLPLQLFQIIDPKYMILTSSGPTFCRFQSWDVYFSNFITFDPNGNSLVNTSPLTSFYGLKKILKDADKL